MPIYYLMQRLIGVVVVALIGIGLSTVLGVSAPLSSQIRTGVVCGVAVQLAQWWYDRRMRARS